MRRNPTPPHVPSTARLYPDQVARLAGEHPAFPGCYQDPIHGVVWFELAIDWPPCSCGVPVRPNRLTCGSRLCAGVR